MKEGIFRCLTQIYARGAVDLDVLFCVAYSTPPSLTFSRAACTSLKSSWAKTSITPSSVAVAALSRLALAAVVVMPVTAPWSSLLASPLRIMNAN